MHAEDRDTKTKGPYKQINKEANKQTNGDTQRTKQTSVS